MYKYIYMYIYTSHKSVAALAASGYTRQKKKMINPIRILVRLVLNRKILKVISRCCVTLSAIGSAVGCTFRYITVTFCYISVTTFWYISGTFWYVYTFWCISGTFRYITVTFWYISVMRQWLVSIRVSLWSCFFSFFAVIGRRWHYQRRARRANGHCQCVCRARSMYSFFSFFSVMGRRKHSQRRTTRANGHCQRVCHSTSDTFFWNAVMGRWLHWQHRAMSPWLLSTLWRSWAFGVYYQKLYPILPHITPYNTSPWYKMG